uniref:Uncharacterized protein n=1 Tax=Heterorhabditis bacteriophora TaxID=37862 RepID=A0A1I7W7S3_HETBA
MLTVNKQPVNIIIVNSFSPDPPFLPPPPRLRIFFI